MNDKKPLNHLDMLLKLLKLPPEATEEQLIKAHAEAMKKTGTEEVKKATAANTFNSWDFGIRSKAFNARLDDFMRPVSAGGKGFKSVDVAIAAMRADEECQSLCLR